MALSAQKRIQPSLIPTLLAEMDFPIAATQTIYKGALIALNSAGDAIPATTTIGLRCAGVADTGSDASINTTGLAAGDKVIKGLFGIFPFKIGTVLDVVTKADVGNDVYVIDDETIGRTDGTTGRCIAGQLVKVDGAKAFVSIGFRLLPGNPNEVAKSVAEVVSAAGAISVATRTTRLAVTGTTAYTLADGTRVGQRKSISVDSGASTPVGTVTPAHAAGFTTVTALGVQGDFVELEWNGAAWILAGSGGVTFT